MLKTILKACGRWNIDKYIVVLIGATFFLFHSPMLAQVSSGTIQVRVETEEGLPLQQAHVLLVAQDGKVWEGVVLDEKGSHQFLQLIAGIYRIEASAEGYITQVRDQLLLNSGDNLKIDFLMQAQRLTLREVEERGAAERNPNIFIRRVDMVALRRTLSRRGIEPNFLQMTSAENQYGTDMGAPVREIFFVKPQDSLTQFHGSIYLSHQNSVLNARPFFNVGQLRSSKRNQYGFSVHNPLFRDKLFFTTSLDFVKESGFVNGNIRVPLTNERTSTAENTETAEIVTALLQAYPAENPNLPNVTPRQLNTNAMRRISSLDWNLRVDYPISERNNLAFQYTLFNYSEDPFELVIGQNPDTDLRPQTFSTTHTYTWSPTTIVQSSFHFDRLKILLLPTKRFRSLFKSLDLNTVPDIRIGPGRGDLSKIGAGNQFPRKRFQNRFTGNIDFSQQRGRHQIKFGGRSTRTQVNDLQSDNSRGTFIFSENFGRSKVENFLKGTPTKFTITQGDLYRGFRNWEHAVYVQDTYQLQPNFTLSLGLRYEVVTVPNEVNNRTQFSYATDANNFAPHLALAWAPTGGSTVVRAGYGISFGHIFPATYQLARFNPPAVTTIAVQNPTLASPLQGVENSEQSERSELLLLSSDLVSPYTQEYNLVIQRRLSQNWSFEIGYVGHRSVKPFFKFVSNRGRVVPGIPSTTETIDSRRLDSRYFRIQTIMNSGTFYYDGVKTSMRGVLTEGSSMSLDYVFSKAFSSSIGDFLWETNLGLGPPISQNNENFLLDLKGPSIFDHRHIFVARYSYDIPFASSHGILRALFGGWKVVGMTDFRTGRWFGMETSSDAPGFGNVDGEGGDRVNVVDPSVLGVAYDDPDTVSSKLRTELFNSDIVPGGRGNAAVRAFRADATFNTNASLTKSFPVGQRENLLQLRIEFQNLFNHPWFSVPGDVFPSDMFGKIVDTRNKGRVIQFMLKVNF